MAENKEKIPFHADPDDPNQTGEKKVPLPPEADPERSPYMKKLQRIVDAINASEAQTAHHLDRIATAIETIAKLQSQDARAPTPLPLPASTPEIPTTNAPTPETPTTDAPTPIRYVETVTNSFSQDLQDMLSFSQTDDVVTIRTKRFLGADNFAKIASIVRGLGGEYISAGKESRFTVKQK